MSDPETGDLFEREPALGAVDAALAAAEAGHGSRLVVIGKPGSGRTRLLGELGRRAGERGFTVLAATGAAAERGLELGVARQLLEDVILGAARARREELLEGAAGIAEPLLSGAPEAGGDFPAFGALHRIMLNLAAGAPVAVCVDDVPSADPASLEFLAYLARRIAGNAIVLAVTAREERSAGEPLALGSVLDDAAAATVRLTALSVRGCSRLLADSLGEESASVLAEATRELTGGNPRLVAELAAELGAHAAETGAAPTVLHEGIAPAPLARRLDSEISALGADAVRLARALATLGHEGGLHEAAQLAGIDERSARIAANSLSLRGLLQSEPPTSLRYPILANAVRATTPPAELSRLSRRAGRLRAESGATATRVAELLLGAGPAADAWTVAALRDGAREELDRGEPKRAVRMLRRALAEPPAEEERGPLLLELGAAAARIGEQDAVQLMESAYELAGDPGSRAQVALELGSALAFAGQAAAAANVLEHALTELEDERSPIGMALLALLLVLAVTTTSARRRAAPRIADARNILEEVDERRARTLLAPIAADEATTGGSAERAAVLARRALGDGRMLAEHTADSPLPYLAAGTLIWADRANKAEVALNAALEEAQGRGSERAAAMAIAARAYARQRAGRLAEAEADTLQFRADGDWLADPSVSAFALIAGAVLISTLLEAGEVAAAERERERLELIPHDPDALLTQPFREARGRLALFRGAADEAAAHFHACGERQQRWRAQLAPVPVAWRVGAAEAHLAAGRRRDAEQLAREAVEVGHGFGAPRAIGLALRVRGLTAADPRHRRRDLEQSVSALAGSCDRVEHARSLAALGAAMRREGRRSAAREPLREALHIASASGASALAAETREELLAAGAKVAPGAASGPGTLTPSELRVAEAAAGGRSNREIADTLFLSVKTIEMHLSNSYRKLDIDSRRDLAGALERARESRDRESA